MLARNNGTNGNKRQKNGCIHVLEIVGNAIVGGMERSVANLVKELPPDTFRFTCLCPFQSPFTRSLKEKGCPVFVAPLRDDPTWRSLQMAVEIVRHHRVDLIHGHLPNAHILAGLTGMITQTPTIATIHGMSLTVHELGISRMTQTHLIVVCQEAYAQALALGIAPQNLSLIPNGIDTELFRSIPHTQRFKAALGLSPEVPMVGFVGRLAWEKGPDEFLRIAARVHQKRPALHFVLVGEGPLREQLVQLIHELGLENCVHLAGLWDDMTEVYSALDVLVVTSRSEGMPLAVLEAMACERPVIAMAVGGVAEIIEEGVSGYLIAPEDWKGGANAYTSGFEGIEMVLINLIDNPEKGRFIGSAARERVKEFYNLSTSANLVSNLYTRLVNRKKTPLVQENDLTVRSPERLPLSPITFLGSDR
jgi:glycosyltransferase involved in cell wall biosynthesis